MAKQPVGYIKCKTPGCGEIASVFETAGTRKQLYTRCPSCGCDQRNGEQYQQWLRASMSAAVESLPVDAKQAAPDAALEPEQQDKKEPVSDPVGKPKGAGVPVLVLALGLIIGGIAAATKG